MKKSIVDKARQIVEKASNEYEAPMMYIVLKLVRIR